MEAYPSVRSLYEEASSVLGYDIAALCFEGPAERLNLTEYTQPALLVSSIAALQAFKPLGITPVAVAGHSLGEYSALVAAGGMTYREAVAIVQKRGRYMAEAVPLGNRARRRAARPHGRRGERGVPGRLIGGSRGRGKFQFARSNCHCRGKGCRGTGD